MRMLAVEFGLGAFGRIVNGLEARAGSFSRGFGSPTQSASRSRNRLVVETLARTRIGCASDSNSR